MAAQPPHTPLNTTKVEDSSVQQTEIPFPIVSSLPASTTPLLGREQAVAAIVALLRRGHASEAVRLVTLTGPGGTGKTRLAMQVAQTLLDTHTLPQLHHGVYFVPLAAIHNPGLVLSAIAQTLGMMEVAGQPLLETLQHFLRDRDLLLLLDNFEQVEAAAPYVATLLTAAPGLLVLVTSRTVLHLVGEHEFPVPPLPLPDLAQPPTPQSLAQNPAVALFVQRAQAVRPTLQLSAENAPAIAEICRRLDGLPLAIELAAARCRILSPQALLARLASPLQLLTTGSQELPARQQTLRATIDWSYQLLTAEEQTLFRRVSIFVGGWTLAAVEEICMTEALQPPVAQRGTLSTAALATLDRLTALVEHSLVQQEEDATGEPRFTMLETIREYAQERLTESRELPLLHQLYVDFYLALAEKAEAKLVGHEQLAWLACLDREHDNLRAALVATKQLAGGSELGLRLAAALWWFWWVRGYISEGRSWLEGLLVQTALEMTTQSFMRVRATALYRAAFLAISQDDYRRGSALGEESLTLFRTLSDAQGMAWAHYVLGLALVMQGNPQQAGVYYSESLTLFRAVNDARGIIWALNDLSNLAHMQGDLARATALANEHLTLVRAVGNPRDLAAGLGHLSGIMQTAGDYQQARSSNEEALALLRRVGDRPSIAVTLHSLAYLAQIQQEYSQAEALFREGLQCYQQIGSRFGIARCLIGLAAVAEAVHHYVRAARLLGAAVTQHQQLDVFLAPDERITREQSERNIRAQLGETAYAAAYATGRTMTPDQALATLEPSQPLPQQSPAPAPTPAATALASAKPPPVIPLVEPPFAELTERELEVLRLLARGLSYTEIADQLIISPRTVNRHLTSIYTKLNVTSRHTATRFALDHGLT